MQEIWKPIEGYEGLYEVNNLGEVRSKRKTLSPGNKNGYKYVGLSKLGKLKIKTIHRLVAIAFIPNPENKPQVNHIDGNKANNSVDNLEWCTSSENLKHAHETGLKKSPKFETNPNAKLTKKEVTDMRNRYVKSCRVNGSAALAKEYGIAPSHAHYIVTNQKWRDIN